MIDLLAAALNYARREASSSLEGFKTLLRFRSISQDADCQPQMQACADWIVAEMRRIGLYNARKLPTAGHPIVYGDWLHAGSDKPTLLIYAHYDVQPIGDEALWDTPPFEPTIIDGRLLARGAADDKCGIWITLKAIEAILATADRLPINIKLMFEGEEELGSPNAAAFIRANRELLAADGLIICDGPFSPRQPIVINALRGMISAELRVTGPASDLHSGRYGGAVKNPAHYLARVIASFHDRDGRVGIRGFYDDAIPMSDQQTRQMNQLWKTIGPDIQRGAGVEAFFGDALGVFAERTNAQPTLDVSAIACGGAAGNIIPSQARCRLAMRTVVGQDADKIWARFVEHVMAFAEPGIHIEADLINLAQPLFMPAEGREIQAIQRALKAALGRAGLLMRHGGSLAIGGILQRELNAPAAMLGLGSGGNSHAPNEFIIVNDMQPATDVAIHLLHALGDEL